MPNRLLARFISPEGWLRLASHGLAIGLVVAAIWLASSDLARRLPAALPPELASPPAALDSALAQSTAAATPVPTATSAPVVVLASLADPTALPGDVGRLANIHTIIPDRPRYEVVTYTVERNDTLFVIAKKFNLKPETILWGNPALADNPNLLSVGQELHILPIDGALRIVQAGDTIDKIATAFHGTPDAIINFPGNNLDPSEPRIETGMYIVIPGGWRDSITWQLPVVTRRGTGPGGGSGEPGACQGPYFGPSGTGAFVWPANNHYLSGTDFLPIGHPGIDIAAGLGAPIYAADSGVVVFSGWSYRGYGNLIIVDHGNGWQTAYAHLYTIFAGCGSTVLQGQGIATSGSTGNSTGPHLHFEMRYGGGRVNPWDFLP